jgi:3',5'-cyclic AMP phosphodiesterase CpdA
VTDRELFFDGGEVPSGKFYRDKESGVIFREIEIDTGSHLPPVKICQITDIHFNALNDEDRKNPELAYTEQCRRWLSGGASALSCDRAMRFSEYADATVITGDVLDFLTSESINLTYRHIWDKYPDTIITTGNHDHRFNMQTRRPEATSLEYRIGILEKAWKHDLYYESRLIGGRVLIIALDNGRDKYSEYQATRLKEDVENARKRGYVILIFQHSPISTGNPEDGQLKALKAYDGEVWDFYKAIGFGAEGSTLEVYKLITENADVIRGIFVGHLHSAFYSEVLGSAKDENGCVIGKTIPQVALEANVYDDHSGHVLKISVK